MAGMNQINYTVTGGLGFIGSHVVDGLLAAGHRVEIIDSTVAAVTDGREYDAHPNCTVHRESIQDYFANGRGFDGIDVVIHAASHVGPAGILQYQGKLGNEIVAIAQLVIDGCLESGSKLCCFSSAEVYGRSGHLGEADAIVVPAHYNARLEYAIAKTLTEAMTINSRHNGLRGLVVRPFNVAGPRQSRAGGFVVPTFVQQALDGRPLTVFAGGQQLRAFLAASELARFMTDHLDAAFASGQPIFNLGNPENATTVWDLAARVVRVLDSPSVIEHHDARAIHGPHYEEAESFQKLPILGAAASVGWAPQLGLDELILETAAFYRDHDDIRADSEAVRPHVLPDPVRPLRALSV
jgi:nucleoside-diphosphate-sugar epimerase